jgi:NMD protein affecting ribosome stability and mRNA decay
MARMWGRILAKQFGGTIKETNTTVGMKDGIEITRLTLSYRKPAYDIGDVMKLKNHYWMIDSWQKDGPILRRMKFFERAGASWRDMEKARIICPVAEQHTVDILNRDSTAAEVMDPIDYRMVTVGLPYDDDGNTTKMRIALIEDNWVAVPGITVEDSK